MWLTCRTVNKNYETPPGGKITANNYIFHSIFVLHGLALCCVTKKTTAKLLLLLMNMMINISDKIEVN